MRSIPYIGQNLGMVGAFLFVLIWLISFVLLFMQLFFIAIIIIFKEYLKFPFQINNHSFTAGYPAWKKQS